MRDRTLIAVVSDEPGWLAAMGAMLASAGMHSLLVGDRASAIAQIAIDAPAVAIVPSSALAFELHRRMGDACPLLVLVTADLAELDAGDEILFQAAYEKP